MGSEEEFQRIIKGEDIWMQSPEIRDRLDRVVNSKTEEEITSLRGVIKFLQCRIRKLQAPPILEEALD